ncbi:hypothetical protein HHK36_009533 [Tetracentron sinense]|uniref:Uncharacterized protein n=1 Tax=Tetracentron sinense TaxID=13715 RepID=A0A834ZD08_TETSI|nr:hypothetical protein HHK36_009533 [Tetracentron sinense]
MGQLQEELKKTKEQLAAMEEEKDQVLDELQEMKKVAQEANMRLSEALSAQTRGSSEIEKSRVNELERASIESAKKRDQVWQLKLEAVQKQHASDVEAISSAAQELNLVRQNLASALKAKDAALKEAEDVRNVTEANAKKVADLSVELNSVKELLGNSSRDLEVREKIIECLKLELVKAQEIEVELAEKEASLDKLKQELSNAKESETKIFDSLNSQTKQLEQTKILLEESKLEISSLHEKVESLEGSAKASNGELDVSHHFLEKAKLNKQSMKENFETLKPEVQVAKEHVAFSQEGEKLASSKAHSLSEETSLLRTELKLATEAEEKSKKAMDDLALALKEVATEANMAKEKLKSTQSELENARGEAEHWKQMVKSTEEKFQGLLDEAKKEIDRVKDEAERLRIESEESILAWNGKEMGFIDCIKRVEEENTASQQENSRLRDSLREAEDMNNKVSMEENHNLRDILKQAINESTVAKEAAEIARAENSQLKDSLSDKDNALDSLTRENERLRINEAAAHENIKELKRLLSTTSTNDLRAKDKDLGGLFNKQNSMGRDPKDSKKLPQVLSPQKTQALKGSIFDIVDSPEPVSHHFKTSSSVYTDDGGTIYSEDFDHLEGSQLDPMENDKNSKRKKKTLLRRFRDLIKRRSFHRKEPLID